jgi:uncharacterized protein
MCMTRAEALQRLTAVAPDLRRVGVTSLYVFGSTARDEARDDSDVDLFVDYEPGKFGLFDLMDAQELAGRALGVRADVMTRDSLHPMLRRKIEESAVRVF